MIGGFDALADPTRLALAAALADTDELCVCDLAWLMDRRPGELTARGKDGHVLVDSRGPRPASERPGASGDRARVSTLEAVAVKEGTEAWRGEGCACVRVPVAVAGAASCAEDGCDH